jgi:F0F1-type ATP synthase membrane subunit b/b'
MHLLAFAESIQLFPDGTIFIHIALILLMIWLLNRTFFRPINRVIESREKQKGGRGRGGEAEGILKEVGEKIAVYDKEMLEARSRGYELIEKEHAAAVAAREKQLVTVKAELSEKLSAEKQELQTQAGEARATIEKEAEKLADTISANILKV